MDTAEQVAQRLATARAAREVVPSDPELSARWHTHGVPSSFSRWNYHPEYEVHLITRGSGWFVVGRCIDVFRAGQLVLVGSNVPHHWISDLAPGERVPDRDIVFQFHPDWLRRCRELMPELGRLDPLLVQSRRGVEFLGPAATEAAEHLAAIGGSSGATRLARIFDLLGQLADARPDQRRVLNNERLPAPVELEDGLADRIDIAYTYILANLDDPDIRLAGAARAVGMSESAFSRYFSRVSGLSFSDTLRRLRLVHAGKLLRETELPVAAIAHRVGFANLSNFNRQFRRHHGRTPRMFRDLDVEPEASKY